MKKIKGGQNRLLFLRLLIALLISLLLTSGIAFAQDEPIPEPQGEPPKAPDEEKLESKTEKEWTFMVYMAADCDLGNENEAVADFLEMAEVGSTDDINIVVQLDRIWQEGNPHQIGGLWGDTRRFYVTKDMVPLYANGTSIGEANMGRAVTLRDFILWARVNYPARKYALIIWNHGNANHPMDDDIPSTGVAWDLTNSGDYLTNKELSYALNQATANGTNKLDLIGFDADLMAHLEVYQHVKDYVKYGVGSEKTGSDTGWPYNAILSVLKNNIDWDGRKLADMIVYRNYLANGSNDTHSAVRLDAFCTTVINRLNTFSNQLIARINTTPNFRANIKAALMASIKMDPEGNFVDLSDFALKIKNRTPAGTTLNAAADNLITAINNFVTRNKVGPAYLKARGITIYFPKDIQTWSDWEMLYQYGQFLARDTHWDEFLDKYYNTGFTIALIWGDTVPDLDAHLYLPSPTPYHVCYSTKGNLTIFPFANLDVDDVAYEGPENINIIRFEPGVYTYDVHKWSPDFIHMTTLRNSGAKVKIYRDGVLFKTLDVSEAGGPTDGRYWQVFTYNSNDDTFAWTNSVSNNDPGPYGLGEKDRRIK